MTLKDFYIAYNNWLDNPYDGIFINRAGLCGNLSLFGLHHKLDFDLIDALENVLYDEFANARLHLLCPFNIDWRDFVRESSNGICHLNPKRIQWVRDHL